MIHRQIYTQQQEIQVSVLTWNCAGNGPTSSQFNIEQVIQQEGYEKSDVYIVGLQEMVPLNTKEIVVEKNKQRALLWQEVIQNCLGPDYIPVVHKTLVGCNIQMFAKREHINRIRGIRKCKVKTGLAGMTGNKGGVALRFLFDDTSFAFINCHLEAGQTKLGERFENLRQIYNHIFNDFSVALTREKNFHDYKCFFGDMNFRVDLPNHEVRELIKQKNITRLLAHDQLLLGIQKTVFTNLFQEAPITFLPTYKFDLNCDEYDTSGKNRIPAYTDRILMCRDS